MIVHAIQYLLCVCAVSGTQYYMIIVCVCVRVRVHVRVRVVGGGWWVVGWCVVFVTYCCYCLACAGWRVCHSGMRYLRV